MSMVSCQRDAGDIERLVEQRDARGVHQDVRRADRVDRLVEDARGGLGVRQVGDDSVVTVAGEAADDLAYAVVDIDAHDRRTALGEVLGDREPDSAGGACDDRDAAREGTHFSYSVIAHTFSYDALDGSKV